jgi:cell division septation protein DedD
MPAPPRKPLGGDKAPAAEKSAAAMTTTAKPSAPEKPAVATEEKKETRTAAVETKKSAATKRAATTGAAAGGTKAAAAGEWWVQVGAFRDHDTARKLAARLREQNYKVEESVRGAGTAKPAAAPEKPAPAASAAAPAGADQYDVFVSGMSAADLSKRLSAKGLAAEATASGAVIKPSLPLRDAVALSKDLAVEGFKVQVRRAAGAAAAAPPPAADRPAEPVAAGGGQSLYRVRVGAFPDRATAMTTLKELEGKGYKPFIARGGH